MNDVVENCVVQKNNVSHGCPDKNAIVEKANVGTNLIMNGISKQRSTGLASEDSKNLRIIVLTISAKSKILSFLTFPFLICN